MASIGDLFRAETELTIKAGELLEIMRTATKAEFLFNAAKCEVPHKFIVEMATGEKENDIERGKDK